MKIMTLVSDLFAAARMRMRDECAALSVQNPATLFMVQIQRLDRQVIEHFEFMMQG